MELTWADEQWVALPERALYWPRFDAILVADLHWGKDATFRAHGIPVSGRHLEDELGRLVRICNGVSRLWVLGDLVHSADGFDAATLDRVREACDSLPSERVLIEGNHDRRLVERIKPWGFEIVNEPWEQGPVNLDHHPGKHERPTLCGHLHPTCWVGKGPDRVRLACFYATPTQMILPAFTGFSNGPVQDLTKASGAWVTTDRELFKVR